MPEASFPKTCSASIGAPVLKAAPAPAGDTIKINNKRFIEDALATLGEPTTRGRAMFYGERVTARRLVAFGARHSFIFLLFLICFGGAGRSGSVRLFTPSRAGSSGRCVFPKCFGVAT